MRKAILSILKYWLIIFSIKIPESFYIDWQSNYKILCSHFYVESKTVNLQKYRVQRWLPSAKGGAKWGGTDQREQTSGLK